MRVEIGSLRVEVGGARPIAEEARGARAPRSVAWCEGFRAAEAIDCGSPGRTLGGGSGPLGRSVAKFPSCLRVALLTVRGEVCVSRR